MTGRYELLQSIPITKVHENVQWLERGSSFIPYTKSKNHFILGKRGAGKSSLVETLAKNYLHHGACLIDANASTDGENLAILRAKWSPSVRVLLLKGKDVKVECDWETKSWDDFREDMIYDYDVIINSSPLYRDDEESMDGLNRILDECNNRRGWSRLICMAVRETANIFYARLKVQDNSEKAKQDAVKLIREGRHHGVSMVMDSLRWTAVDIDIRVLSDFIFLKKVGIYNMPSDLSWIYHYYEAEMMRRMPPSVYVMIDTDGPIGHGYFQEHIWHKEPNEDILKNLGIKVFTKRRISKLSYDVHLKILKLKNSKEDAKPEDIGLILGYETKDVKREIAMHEYKLCECFQNEENQKAVASEQRP